MFNLNNIRNIGIVAHVDAGKTTLSEGLLFKSGVIRSIGSVDKGTAHTDFLEVERERGISVKAAEAAFNYKGMEIHIIDTPGHVDFAAEVERALRVLDGAIIVISAVEGVQPQTEVYFKALQSLGVPVIFFINKLDRMGADIVRVTQEIRTSLTKNIFSEQTAEINGRDINIKSVFSNELIEFVAERDENLLEKYLSGETIEIDEVKNNLKKLVLKSEAYPLFYGSALKDIGVAEILEAIIDFLPSPKPGFEDKVSAVVYKISQDKNLGKLAHVRMYSGYIENREEIYNYTKDVSEKISQIKKLQGLKTVDFGQATCGELAILSGLSSASIGDILGFPDLIPKAPNIANPLLTIQVFGTDDSKLTDLVEALMELEAEDPLLRVQWIKEKREINIQIMGTIQLEIIQSILKQRYDMEVTFGKPSVIYKETLLKEGYGFDAYTMPKPCWAILRFKMEPLPLGSGFVYDNLTRNERIKQRYQREVEKRVPEALQQGLYGWEVIDVKITLVEGEDHYMHTHPGDFIVATPMAIMDGLRNIGTTLLEPMIQYRISVPEDCGGKVLSDLINMRGSFDNPIVNKGVFTVEGQVPVANSLDYSVRLAMLSSGKGFMTTSFNGYKPCPLELGQRRERIGVNPLDRAKYILSVRNAL